MSSSLQSGVCLQSMVSMFSCTSNACLFLFPLVCRIRPQQNIWMAARAIKPAAKLTRSGVVGVLATAGTLSAGKYNNTKESLPGSVTFVEHVGEGFVEQVESLDWTSDHARGVVEASLRPLLDKGADCIVLGCTHYPFLSGLIQDIAGPDVKVIDSAPAIAKQLLKVIKEENIPYGEDGGGSGKVSLYASGDKGPLLKTFEFISGS